MASISAWVDSNIVTAGKRGQASKVVGSRSVEFSQTYEKLGTADGDGSVLGIMLIPANAVLRELKLNSDALTGFSSVSVGLYRLDRDGVTFVDTAKSDGTSAKAILKALTDLAAGFAIGSESNLLSAVDVADLPKKIYELLGFTAATVNKADGSYVLALTAATSGTAAGTITVSGRYILA